MLPTLRRLLGVLMLAPLLLLAACGEQEVYGKLKENQANEMIAVLKKARLSASKAAAGEGQWSVSVAQEDFSRAVDVLRANGLPRDEFQNLGEIFAKKGFVSSPVEERARLIYGLSQELSQTVNSIDGVIEARVHLAIPEPDPLSDKLKPSSAAVFIKYQPGFELRNQTGAIKSLVTNSIEGLNYDKVSVVMFPAQAPPEPQALTVARFDTPLMRLLLLIAAAAWAGRLLYGRYRARPKLPVVADRP